jgi:hypothetical protein
MQTRTTVFDDPTWVTALGGVTVAVLGIVAGVWVFTRGLRLVGGLRAIERRYPAANRPTAELKLGKVWLLGNFWILAASDASGIHLEGSVGGEKLVFVPWTELRLVFRLPGVHLFRFAHLREWVCVRSGLVPKHLT